MNVRILQVVNPAQPHLTAPDIWLLTDLTEDSTDGFWHEFIVCHVWRRLMRWQKKTATLRHECNRRSGVLLQVRYLSPMAKTVEAVPT